MDGPSRRRRGSVRPVPQRVAAFTIHRADGVSLMLRVLPGGTWRLREYDADGNEDRGK